MAAPSCPDCLKGGILPGEPKGFTSDVQGAYLSANPSPTSSSRAIILLTDIFGLQIRNPKIIADHLAKELDCDVWVPDIFNGNPPFGAHQLKIQSRAGDKHTFWELVKTVFSSIPRIPSIIRNRPSVVESRVTSFVKTLKEEKKYEKLGAIGYCFGGILVCNLGSTDAFNSLVINHPGPLSRTAIENIKAPTSWACAEDDFTFPAKDRLNAEALFAARKGKENFVEYEFKEYKGTAHGFATRPHLQYPEVKEAYEGALKQAVDWFNKTIPA